MALHCTAIGYQSKNLPYQKKMDCENIAVYVKRRSFIVMRGLHLNHRLEGMERDKGVINQIGMISFQK